MEAAGFQVPLLTARVCPTCAVPLIAGCTSAAGPFADETIGVGSDVASFDGEEVGGHHVHQHRVRDVGRREGVGVAGRPADVIAVAPVRVAALPLVGVRRWRERPAAVRRRQRRARGRCAVDRRGHVVRQSRRHPRPAKPPEARHRGRTTRAAAAISSLTPVDSIAGTHGPGSEDRNRPLIPYTGRLSGRSTRERRGSECARS